MVRNNKGFSLVELIVAFGILAVLSLALMGFLVNSSSNFNRSNDEIGLQYEQQLVVNQIRDIILESAEGIYYDDDPTTNKNVLSVYGSLIQSGDDKDYPVSFLSYNSTEKKLYISENVFDDVASIAYPGDDAENVLSESISAFNVDLTNVSDRSVSFSVTFESNGKTKVAEETVALRNTLVVSQDADVIWDEEPEVVGSFIEAIVISRGVQEFAHEDADEIGKRGEKVFVEYTANVLTNDFSTREYGVDWTLSDIVGVEANAPGGIKMTKSGKTTVVEVDPTVPDNTKFRLTATSVEDITKYAYITITVTDDGVYADSMTLTKNEEVEFGNGYNTYTVEPALKYTNGDIKTDYSLFNWKVEVTPLEEEQVPETGEEAVEEEPVVECYGFDEETGKLILYTSANGRTITVTATAKEKNFKGEVIEAFTVFQPTDIPEYIPGTSVRVEVAPEMSRGGFLPVSIEVLNPEQGAEYVYEIKMDKYYSDGFAQWDGIAKNSEFAHVSFSNDTVYDEKNVIHETELEETRINLTCSKKLNWANAFRLELTAVATDQDGNAYTSMPVEVTIPAVQVVVKPTTNVKTESLPLSTRTTLQYEDWYYNEIDRDSPTAKRCTSRRWFDISLEYLVMDEDDFNSFEVKNNFNFRNLLGNILSAKVVPYPSSTVRLGDKQAGFTARLWNWERLANRPVFMIYSVTVSDGFGNTQTSEGQQFVIVYELYPNEE